MRKIVLVSGLVLVLGCGGGDKTTNTPTTTTSATATPPTVGSGGTTTQTPPKAPLADLIKKTLADFDLAFASHDAAKCVGAYAADATYVQPGPNGWNEIKKDDIQKRFDNLFKGFPDVKLTPTRTFIKGNVVAMEGVMTGTHAGDFMGHASTGKKIGGRYFSVIWFNDDGLISKEHIYHDHAAMLGHLGKGDPKLKHRNLENVPTMTLEQIAPGDNALEAKNEAATRAWLSSFEKKDDKAYLANISEDVTHADYTRPEDVKGKDAAKKAWGELLKTFPDIKMTPNTVVAIGDYVIAEVEMSGTMKGDLGSVKPSGKAGMVHLVDVLKYNKEGKISWAGRWGSRAEFANAFGVPVKLPAATTTTAPTATTTTPAAKK